MRGLFGTDIPDLVAFMLATGLRVGECLALRWCDVDLGAGTVDVNSTLLRVQKVGLVRRPVPKTFSSSRLLRLPDGGLAALNSEAPATPVELMRRCSQR